MNIKSNIFITILAILAVAFAQAQETIPAACAGTVVRYGVGDGLPGSVFEWTITGGTIVNNYSDSVDVLWGNDDGTFTIQVIEHSAFECTAQPFDAQVEVLTPFVEIGDEVHVCEGDTQFVNVTGNYLTYRWSTGDVSTNEIPISEPGLVWVEVMDANNCITRDSVIVYLEEPPEVDLGSDQVLCGNDVYELDAGSSGLYYKWSTGEDTRSIYVEPGEQAYVVSVEDRWGCENADTMLVLDCDYVRVIKSNVPTAFTPNGDDYNDLFFIPGLEEFTEVEVEIFDRWGRRVFKSDAGYNNPWDGTFNGTDLPTDSYYYVIDLKDGSEPVAGSVSILR